MTKTKTDRANASKAAWERARQLAERDGISAKEARSVLAKNPNALDAAPKKAMGPKKRKGKTSEAKKPRAKKEVNLADAEASLIEKYPHLIPGTLQGHTDGRYANRRTVKIRCANPECKNSHRRVATSDLWQVKFCEQCTKANRAKKRSKRK